MITSNKDKIKTQGPYINSTSGFFFLIPHLKINNMTPTTASKTRMITMARATPLFFPSEFSEASLIT